MSDIIRKLFETWWNQQFPAKKNSPAYRGEIHLKVSVVQLDFKGEGNNHP